MANDNVIKEIGGKLREHSSQVDSKIWETVRSQLGAGAVASISSNGIGLTKIASIIAITVSTVAIIYFVVMFPVEEKNREVTKVHQTYGKNRAEKSESTIRTKSTPIVEKEEVNDALVNENRKYFIEDKPLVIVAPFKETVSNKPFMGGTIVTPVAPEPLMSIANKTETIKVEETILPSDTIKQHTNGIEVQEVTKIVTLARFINLPNTFTPNNDGVNDLFFIETVGMYNYQLVVMDSKNNVVWRTNDANEKWDGRNMGGEKLPSGSYLYFITAEDENGNPMHEHKRLEIQ
jgi:gliding motility-associated-like protein